MRTTISRRRDQGVAKAVGNDMRGSTRIAHKYKKERERYIEDQVELEIEALLTETAANPNIVLASNPYAPSAHNYLQHRCVVRMGRIIFDTCDARNPPGEID